MTVRILPTALADLDNIDAYLTRTFGASVAACVEERLFRVFEQLADFPEMGRPRPDVTLRPVRFFLLKPYWIVYSSGADLLVHRVYHAARDLDRFEGR